MSTMALSMVEVTRRVTYNMAPALADNFKVHTMHPQECYIFLVSVCLDLSSFPPLLSFLVFCSLIFLGNNAAVQYP